nr:MAG TPA: hypothetical protein [Siphoviridae sp. ctYuc6]
MISRMSPVRNPTTACAVKSVQLIGLFLFPSFSLSAPYQAQRGPPAPRYRCPKCRGGQRARSVSG